MARKSKDFLFELDKKDQKELTTLLKGVSSDIQKKKIIQGAAVKGFNPTLIKEMRSNARKYYSTKSDAYRSIGFRKSSNRRDGQWYVDFGVRLGGKRGSTYAGYLHNFFEKGTVVRTTKAGANRGSITKTKPVFWPAYYRTKDKAGISFANHVWDDLKKRWNRRKKGR